jgi:hypothetical protein
VIVPIPEPDLYEQDGESCRYQDTLRWSRFQTAAVIEGGLAYAVWGLDNGIGPVTTILLTSGGAILILLLWLLSYMDANDYSRHLGRMQNQETHCPDFPFPDRRRLFPKLRGTTVMYVSWGVLFFLNIFMIVRAFVGRDF